MDIFDLRAKHTINLEGLLSEEEIDCEPDGIEDSFRKTKWLLQKELNLKWHLATLNQYIEHKIIPRSLRWDLSPDDLGLNEESDNEWAQFFLEKGFELIRFIMKRKQKKLVEVQKNIEGMQKSLEKVKKTEKFTDLSRDVFEHLERTEFEIKKKKISKFRRDLGDFKGGSVFKWQKNTAEKRGEESQYRDAPSQGPGLPPYPRMENSRNQWGHRERGPERHNYRPQQLKYPPGRPNKTYYGPYNREFQRQPQNNVQSRFNSRPQSYGDPYNQTQRYDNRMYQRQFRPDPFQNCWEDYPPREGTYDNCNSPSFLDWGPRTPLLGIGKEQGEQEEVEGTNSMANKRKRQH